MRETSLAHRPIATPLQGLTLPLLADVARGFGPMLWQELTWFLEDNSTPEPNTGCLLWTGKTDKRGYGRINWRGLQLLAHRTALELAYGELPESLEAHHHCLQPSCVNGHHLVPVTAIQHARIHSGLGQLGADGCVDLFATLAEQQARAGLTIPFPLSAIARHHRHPVSALVAA